MRVLLYTCFFLSGAAALIYEIVWQRMLTVVFGVSTLSVAAVLSAFLAGLAIGARAWGPAADRTARPVRLYALLEFGVAAAALGSAWFIPRLMDVYRGVYPQLPPGPFASNALRFGLALAAVGIPCIFIGATVPLMARLVAGWAGSPGAAFGRFNAVNTLGAVLGAGAAGFLLLPSLGVTASLYVAVGVSIVAALIALPLDSIAPAPAPNAQVATTPEVRPAHPRFALVAAAVTGSAALAYETAWIRLLAVYTFNSVYLFTMVVTVFLTALAIGSALAARILRQPRAPVLRGVVAAQSLLALAGPILLALVPRAADLDIADQSRADAEVMLVEYLLSAAVVFLPAALIGMTLPLLVALFAADRAAAGRQVARIYAWNAAGNILGAALTGAVLIPLIGMRGTLLALSAMSFAVASAAWALDSAGSASPVRRAFHAATATAFVALTALAPPATRFYRPTGPDERVLYYAEGPSATVHVSEFEGAGEGDGKPHRTLFVDSQSVAGTYDEIVTDQKMLAHLPLLLHPRPQRALTVGFGTGGTSYSMLLHRGVAVDCVEIEPRVPAAYRLFESENLGLVGPDHERHNFHLVLDDARAWLHVAPYAYDVIVTDVTSIQYRGNGNLYTTDYFALMRRKLTGSGLGCAWVPLTGVTPEQLKVLVRSFRSVFPHTGVWYMVNLPTDFVILIGSPARLELDLADWAERMSRPLVRKDLARVGLSDPYKLASCLLVAEDGVAGYVGDGPLHTDDRPILDYMTHASRNRNTLSENLSQMLAQRSDAAAYVSRWPEPEGGAVPPPRWLTWSDAAAHLIQGHAHLRAAGAERLELARQSYREAAALIPEDERTRMLLAGLDAGAGSNEVGPDGGVTSDSTTSGF